MLKYPKDYLEEIKLRVKVSQVVGKSVQLKKKYADQIDFAKAGSLIREMLTKPKIGF